MTSPPPSSVSENDVKVRLAWVDYTKGISLFLVVFGHVLLGLVNANLIEESPVIILTWNSLYSFHVAVFFFISGIFLGGRARRSTRDFLQSMFCTLAYPYLVWTILHCLIQSLMSRYTNSPYDLRDLWKLVYLPTSQFWFLFTLLWISLIYFALSKIGFNAWLVLAAFILMAIAIPGLYQPSWSPLVLICRHGLYVALGATLYRIPSWARIPLTLSNAHACLVSIAGYLAIVVLTWMWPPDPETGPATLPIHAILGIVATISLASLLAHRGWLDTVRIWGVYSLEIYVAHIIVSAGIRIFLSKALRITDPTAHLLLGVFAGIYIPILIATGCHRIGFDKLFRLKYSPSR
jgi:fucose 4-O-acetylase-like acetyltransferase